MATLTWTGAAKNGNWDDPLNWSISGQPAGRIPGSGDDVDMGGGPHLPFPTLSSNATVNSVVVNETTFVASGATLNVANSLSVVSSFVDMSFDVAGAVQAGAIANLGANGLLSRGQRTHFVIEAGGTLIDRDTPGTRLANAQEQGIDGPFVSTDADKNESASGRNRRLSIFRRNIPNRQRFILIDRPRRARRSLPILSGNGSPLASLIGDLPLQPSGICCFSTATTRWRPLRLIARRTGVSIWRF